METASRGGVTTGSSDSDGSATAPLDVVVASGSEAGLDLTRVKKVKRRRLAVNRIMRKIVANGLGWYGLLDLDSYGGLFICPSSFGVVLAKETDINVTGV